MSWGRWLHTASHRSKETWPTSATTNLNIRPSCLTNGAMTVATVAVDSRDWDYQHFSYITTAVYLFKKVSHASSTLHYISRCVPLWLIIRWDVPKTKYYTGSFCWDHVYIPSEKGVVVLENTLFLGLELQDSWRVLSYPNLHRFGRST